MPHIFLPSLPLEEKQFSFSMVRELPPKLQPKCIQVLLIPICSNASTVFWVKWFLSVFSIMVMLKQSSLSSFPLLWKTSSSGFLSLDQVSLYPWISLVTFHWTGDALKASLIWGRVIPAVVLTRQGLKRAKVFHSLYQKCLTRPILQLLLPFSMAASHCWSDIWQCISTPSLTDEFLAHGRNSYLSLVFGLVFSTSFHPVFLITEVSKSSVLVVLTRFASLAYVICIFTVFVMWWMKINENAKEYQPNL